MREIRLYGSEGGGAVCSPYPYRSDPILNQGSSRRRTGGMNKLTNMRQDRFGKVSFSMHRSNAEPTWTLVSAVA